MKYHNDGADADKEVVVMDRLGEKETHYDKSPGRERQHRAPHAQHNWGIRRYVVIAQYTDHRVPLGLGVGHVVVNRKNTNAYSEWRGNGGHTERAWTC